MRYLFIFLLFIPLISFSQEEDTLDLDIPDGVLKIRAPKEKKPFLKFLRPENISVYNGLTFGTENTNVDPIYFISTIKLPYPEYQNRGLYQRNSVRSYNLGFRMEYRLGKIFSLCPGLGIYQTGSKEKHTESYTSIYGNSVSISFLNKHKYSYLDLPIYFKAMASWLRLHPYLGFGIDIGYNLKAVNSMEVNIAGPAGTMDTLAKYGNSFSPFSQNINAPNFLSTYMYTAGLGYYLNRRWEIQLELRGYARSNKIATFNGIDVNLRTLSLNIGLSYHFKDQYRRNQYNSQRFTKSKKFGSPDNRYKYEFEADHIALNFGAGANKTKVKSDNKPPYLNGAMSVLAFIELSYLKSIRKNTIREIYARYGAELLQANPNLSYIINDIIFNCGEAGIDYQYVSNNYSRVKPFAGFGAGIKQLFLAGFESPDYALQEPNMSSVPMRFHFYRIPNVLVRMTSGCYIKLNNEQMLKFVMYANYGLNKFTMLHYDHVVNNNKLETGTVRSNNLNFGITLGYTIFHIKSLKKILKKES